MVISKLAQSPFIVHKQSPETAYPQCRISQPCPTCRATAELLRIVRKPKPSAFVRLRGAQ